MGAPPQSDDESDDEDDDDVDVDDEEQNWSGNEQNASGDRNDEEESDENDDENGALPPEGYDSINLDITAVFVMVSALTHPGGANFKFREPLLDSQAAIERQNPALPPVLRAIEGSENCSCSGRNKSGRILFVL